MEITLLKIYFCKFTTVFSLNSIILLNCVIFINFMSIVFWLFYFYFIYLCIFFYGGPNTQLCYLDFFSSRKLLKILKSNFIKTFFFCFN